MRVSVALEHRFCATPDGVVWTPASFAYSFWERYLKVFDDVRIIARVLDVDRPQTDWKCVEGPRVSVVALPHYVGPLQFVLKRGAVRRARQVDVR